MRLITLHDVNNPSREIPIDAEDFSHAAPLATGSAVRLKSAETPVLVHESPSEIRALLEAE